MWLCIHLLASFPAPPTIFVSNSLTSPAAHVANARGTKHLSFKSPHSCKKFIPFSSPEKRMLNEKLQSVLQELKSVRTVIALLQQRMKNTLEAEADRQQNSVQKGESIQCESASRKWIHFVYDCNRRPQNIVRHLAKQDDSYNPTSNKYLLTYLLTTWSRVLLEELIGSAASQEIPRILWNPKVHHHTSARHLSLS